MTVGANECVGEGLALLNADDAREVLQVDLVNDSGVGRYYAELLERLLPPAQELVALAVTLKFALRIDRK